MAEITIKKASLSDAEELHKLQIASFRALLLKYQDYSTNPGAEPLMRTVRRLQEPITDYYFIRLGDENIGGIRVVHIGTLCKLKQIYILPAHQGNGYAQRAIALTEALYPDAARWELDTIAQEEKLCHLYEKMGYRRTGESVCIKRGMDLINFAK